VAAQVQKIFLEPLGPIGGFYGARLGGSISDTGQKLKTQLTTATGFEGTAKALVCENNENLYG
jgi:hypothetical protein